jgi:hypothetical protein
VLSCLELVEQWGGNLSACVEECGAVLWQWRVEEWGGIGCLTASLSLLSPVSLPL